jgi:hypothetical protein
MFAVVGPQRIAVLTQTKPSTLDTYGPGKTSVGIVLDLDRAAAAETLERHLLHRSGAPARAQAGVVDDAAAAGVDAVVCVAATRGDEMGAKRQLI